MIALRDYQATARRRVWGEIAAGRHRVCLVVPTGGGKTRIGAACVEQAVEKGHPVLWLAHRNELVEQAATTLESFGIRVGVLSAKSRRKPDPDALVQVASIQTLVARDTVRPPAMFIVWDECHHASDDGAETWTSLLSAYPDAKMLGLTATPERGDGAGLAPLFTGLAVGASVRELTALWESDHTQGLVPCNVVRPGKMLEPGQIAQDPIEGYRTTGGGKQGILFARSVEEAQTYAARFNEAGVRAECVTGVTGSADREASLVLFRRGIVRMLTNVYVLTEGTDLPMAEWIGLARGAGSASIYLQMTGRGLRPWPGKEGCTLWDGRGVSWLHGYPDDERSYSLVGKGIALKGDAKCAVCKAVLGSGYPCSRCGYQPTQSESSGATEVVGVPMSAARRWGAAADEQQRTRTLLKWAAVAVERGYKPGWIKGRWRGTFTDELSNARLRWAIEEVRRGAA